MGLEGHYRTNLEKLLGKMGQHVEQSVIIMAKMEYAELMEIEKKLKELDTKLVGCFYVTIATVTE